ncbi:hypothetical protein C8F04DRAFT_1238954 [Mycena alexandri]|uniref:MYND-type domain-containing protein n=1 Tax=Mycena alexandri TaxID=1745969 RepID=A0AAD6WUE0_9AGAR|nr:hypothetical protein C8F04DRAFT_1238954 [Mycena alexandri]
MQLRSPPSPIPSRRRPSSAFSHISPPPGTRYGDAVPVESPDDMHNTKSAGIAITALASILRRYRSTPYWPNALQRLVGCWPSTLMGLLFYARALLRREPPPPMTEVDSPAYTFTAIITLLQMYADVESLAALVRRTPQGINLVSRLWAFEILNSRLSTQLTEMFPDLCQPTAAGLLNYTYLRVETWSTPVPPYFSHYRAACQTFPRSLPLAWSIFRGAQLLSIDLRMFPATDQIHTNLRNLGHLHSTALHLHLLSLNSVGIVTQALVALVSRPFEAASADVTAGCITQICEYLQKYVTADGLTWLNQSLELGLLLALLKAHPWLAHKKSALDAFTSLMIVHLPRYFIYISILRQVNKSFDAFLRLGWMSSALSDPCRKVWLAFYHYVRMRLKVASPAELQVLPCDNLECNQQSSMRCSSCYDTVYCSNECQMKTWNSHIESCQARAIARQAGTPPDLGAADVQFALRVAQHDFEECKADVCRRWTEAGTLPAHRRDRLLSISTCGDYRRPPALSASRWGRTPPYSPLYRKGLRERDIICVIWG